MKEFMMRLRSKKGESLIESMAAILIFTMASIIMLTMVTASADINSEAKKAEESHQKQLLVAEKAEGTADTQQVGITITDASGTTKTYIVAVDVYAQDENSLYAYYPTEVSGS